MSINDTLEVYTESTTATYPNALRGPWVTRVEKITYGPNEDLVKFAVRAHTDDSQFPKLLRLFDVLDEALAAFAEQERKVRESGVTAETPRQGRCGCGSITENLMLWNAQPFNEYESNYDGCRGWD